MLRSPRQRLDWINGTFTNITRMKHGNGERDEHGNYLWRARRADEYPENDPEVWADVIAQVDSAIRELRNISGYAADQYQEAAYRQDNSKDAP
jgi:hypothetical protein